MSAHLSISDRAQRAAEGFELIANAATTEQPPAQKFENPLQLADAIGYDMLFVLDWIERKRDARTAAVLRKRSNKILLGMDKAPKKTESGALVSDLFDRARKLAWSLHNWADDIEKEESSARLADDRLTFDDQSQTVTLDGQQYSVDEPKVYFLYKAIASGKGKPITRAELRQQEKNFKGDKTIPNTLNKLPPQLRCTIKSGVRGYWLQLPSAK